MENIINVFKKVFTGFLCTVAVLFLLACLFLLWGSVGDYYNYNVKYSIAMPEILGGFNVADTGYISIQGIEKGKNIGRLSYVDFYCYEDCHKLTATISGISSSNYIQTGYDDYKITYRDNDKILFKNDVGVVSGEIDLNAKTLLYTIKYPDSIEQIEVITDNEKIKNLEKKIIRKYLRKKFSLI